MSTTVAVVGSGKDENALVEAGSALVKELREAGANILRASVRGKTLAYDLAHPEPEGVEHKSGAEGGTHHWPGRFVLSIVSEGARHADQVAAVKGFLGAVEKAGGNVSEALVEGRGLQTQLVPEPVSA